ncbi:MAG TPA: alcohol dehydrogenase catalytic domain-containing protein [Streptosporangiaceae bacterium]
MDVACCDLDVSVAEGRAPLSPGYAQGHEGIAEVVETGAGVTGVRPGDRVIVPFQVSCGQCRECPACAVALGAHVDYVDTDAIRLAAAERLGAAARDRDLPDRSWAPYPVTVSTSARPEALVATLRATWPGGVCTCTSIFFGDRALPLPLWWMYTSGVRFVTGRVNARADIPAVLDVLAAGTDLAPAVESVVEWADAPAAWAGLRGKTIVTRDPVA